MVKENNQKIKLLKVFEILRHESDEDSPLTTNEILFKLKELGICCDRRTLYSDINLLNACGYEIVKVRSKRNKYYVLNREFDIPELKILIDAVHAAPFITEKKSDVLIGKIAALAGQYRAGLLKQDIVCFGTAKHTNEKIFYHIDTINNCILSDKKVSFLYFDYGTDGARIYRKEGKRYAVNPVSLVFSNDNYYLVCYSDKYENISDYRVDRMDEVKEEAEEITDSPVRNRFDKNKFRRQVFSMFVGEPAEVEIVAENDLTNVIIDKFGENIKMTPCGGNCFQINVKVQPSPTFYSWCCAFGNKLKVISPQSVIDEIKSHIAAVSENYR